MKILLKNLLSFPGREPTPEELRTQLLKGKNISKRLRRSLDSRVDSDNQRTLKLGAADDFFDNILGIEPENVSSSQLPEQMHTYIATSISACLRMFENVKPTKNDVLCDVGAGLCRIPILSTLLYGIDTIGVELDPVLCDQSRKIIEQNNLQQIELIEEDACTANLERATIFSFNLPFDEAVFERFMQHLKQFAKDKQITIYPFCWHYLFWNIPWLSAVKTNDIDEYFFVSR